MELKIGWCQAQPSCCQGSRKGQGRKKENGYQSYPSDIDKYFFMTFDGGSRHIEDNTKLPVSDLLNKSQRILGDLMPH